MITLNEYIDEVRDLASNLEDDVSTLTDLADSLEMIKDEIEDATDFYEIKDALEELTTLTENPSDLIIPDYNTVTGNFDLEGWNEEYARTVTVGTVKRKHEIVIEPEEKKKGKK